MALTSKLVLVDLWVNKIPLCSAFSMKTCWHCWVSSLYLTSSSFYFSIHTLPHKASTASVHQVLGCIHRSCPSALCTDMSLWLPHSHEWRTSGSDNPGAIPQLPIPLSYEARPTPFHRDAEWHFTSSCLLFNLFLTLLQTSACTFWLQTVD